LCLQNLLLLVHLFEGLRQFGDATTQQKKSLRIITAHIQSCGKCACSFDHILTGASGQKLSALGWPVRFPATGVAELFRECKHAPQDLGGQAKNVRHVRLDMTCFLHETAANPDHIFGLGDHACLGRSHARGLWQRIAADMRQNPMRVRHISTGPSPHKLLTYPGTVLIEVLP